MAKELKPAPGEYTKEALKEYLADIEQKVINSGDAYLQSVVALNQLLRDPKAYSLIDEELKGQMRDLWIKLKSTGVQLKDPPMLFGLPENFGQEEIDVLEDEEVRELDESDVIKPKAKSTAVDGERPKDLT